MKRKGTKTFVIPGILPGLNEIIDHCKRRKGSWNSYAELKGRLTGEISLIIREHRIGRFDQPIWLRFVWFERNKRRDPDNVAAGGRKFILDAMVKAKTIPDDGWKYVAGWFDKFEVSKDNPRVLVSIEPAT